MEKYIQELLNSIPQGVTNWDREDSEFPLEVEICFEEGEVMWIDELHGNYIFPH